MDVNTNVLLAKKYIVDSIYHAANIEGIVMTFPETQTICDGISVPNKSIDDINAICDLKRAWEWLFENIDNEINIKSLKKINALVGKFTVINAGQIRTFFDEQIQVRTKNGIYYPEIPDTDENIDSHIKEICKEKTINNALDLYCYVTKSQFFNNGNKRTANLFTNMFLIQNGLGIFIISDKDKLEFYDRLSDYYEDDNKKDDLKKFLKDKCLIYHRDLSINEKFINLRKKYNVTRQDISNATNIDEKLLFDFERGNVQITQDVLKKISDYFVSLDKNIDNSVDKVIASKKIEKNIENNPKLNFDIITDRTKE